MTLKETFAELDLLRAELQTFQPLRREDEERLWKKFRLEWNFNSNHMEGNTLTYGHTKLLLFFDKVTGDYSGREIEEMKSHDVAIRMVEELAKEKERDLTETFIRQLNETILVRPFWKEAETQDGQKTRREIIPGEYKKFANSVRLENGETFNYSSPEETPAQVNDLMNFYRIHAASTETHPIWLAAMLHYKFVLIHPFDDGNGRVARLLTNYVLMKKGFPPLVIKSNEKKAYLTALNKADTGDLEAYVQYMAGQLKWSLQTSLKAAKGHNIDEEGDLDKRIKMLEKRFDAIDKNEEVVFLNQDIFYNILNSWLASLINETITQVQKFNKFFTGTKHNLSIINVGESIDFVDEPGIELVGKLLDNFIRGKSNLSSNEAIVKLDTRFGTLKKGGLKTFGCNYSLEIKFTQIKYEIYIDEFIRNTDSRTRKKLFERLLTLPLSNEENIQIASQLASNIYEHIEYYSTKNGLI